MLNLEWTGVLAWALRKLAGLFPRNIVTVTLLLVARFTEVRVAPAEPLGDGAAEFALELDKVGSMRLTVSSTQAELL